MFIITLDDPNGTWRPMVQVYTGSGSDNGWADIGAGNYNVKSYLPKARRFSSLQAYGSSDPIVLYKSNHPENTDYYIVNPTLKLEKGKAGSLEFTMLPNHPCYNKIYRLRSIVRVFQVVGNYFYELQKCRVIEIEIDISRQKKVTCAGDLSYLGDSIQPPRTGVKDGKPYDYKSPKEYFEKLIENHTNVSTGGIYINEDQWNGHAKEFTIGKNQLKNDVLHSFKNTSYNTTESIIEGLLSSYGGFLRTRSGGWIPATDKNGARFSYADDKGNIFDCWREFRIIDYLSDRKVDSNGNIVPGSDESEVKNITYGINLVDLNVTWTSDEYFNTLVPTGDSQSGGKGSGSALPLTIEGASGAPTHGGVYLTIGDVINAHKGTGKNANESDAFYNAIGRFTRVVRTENFSGIKKADELLKKAQEFMLNNYTESPDTYTVTAIDNFELGTATKPIFVGDLVRLDAKASHGIDVVKECVSIQYDLTNPAGTEFELGEKRKNLTDQFKDESKSSGGRSSSKSKSSESSTDASEEQSNENTQAISEKTSKSGILETLFGENTTSAIGGISGLLSFDKGSVGDFISDGKIDIGEMISTKLNEKVNGNYIPTDALDDEPTLYPSVDIDEDTEKIYIGRTWSSKGPNFFKITDTKTYKDMRNSLIVSVDDITVARRRGEDDDGNGYDVEDYEKGGTVYLPLTVTVAQSNNVIKLDDLSINESTYTPVIVYDKIDKTANGKTLFAKTPFSRVQIPSECYTPVLSVKTIENKNYYVATTKFGEDDIGESNKIEVPVNSGSNNVVISNTEIKKFEEHPSASATVVTYRVTGDVNGQYNSNIYTIPTSVYTPVFKTPSNTTDDSGAQYFKAEVQTTIAGKNLVTSNSYKTWIKTITSVGNATRTNPVGINKGSVSITLKTVWKITDPLEFSSEKAYYLPENVMSPRFSRPSTATWNYWTYSKTTHTYKITAYTGISGNYITSELGKSKEVFRQATVETKTEGYDHGYEDGTAYGKTLISALSGFKRNSSYTDDPSDTKNGKQIGISGDIAKHLLNRNVGTYQFTVNGQLYWFNLGNKPNNHGDIPTIN